MLKYEILFQIALVLYCLSSFAFVRSPLSAATYFMVFRAVFSVVGFIGISIVGLPYFFPPLLLLLIPVFYALTAKQMTFRLYPPAVFYLLFCALIVFETPFFVARGTSLMLIAQELLKIMFPFLIYILFYTGIVGKQDISRAGRNILLVATIPVLVGFLSVLTQTGYEYTNDVFVPLHSLIAPASTLISRNLFGIFLALCLCCAIGYALETKTKKAFLFMSLILVMLVIAQNRGTWIAMLFAVAASVFLFRQHLNIGKWFLGAAAVIMLASPVMISRFAQLEQYDQWGQSQNTAEDRLETWKGVLNLALETPLVGGGPFAFRQVMIESIGLPHNDYLRVISEYGFIAIPLFIMFLLSQFFRVLRHRDDTLWHWQFAACIGQIYIIIISVAQNVLTDMPVYMLLFALMAISHRAAELSGETEARHKIPHNFLIGSGRKGIKALEDRS